MKVESGLTSSVLLGRDLEIDFRFSDFNYKLRSTRILTVVQQSPTGRVNIYANVFAFGLLTGLKNAMGYRESDRL